MDTIIIGAGAAGLAAAVTLKKENSNASVAILERASKAGKKILVSGNGRCNLSNVNAAPKYYNNPAFLEELFKTYNYEYIKRFYGDLGLLICARDDEGRAYPVSNAAASVMDVYSAAIKKYGVEIIYNTEVADIEKYSCDSLIWAAGNAANDALKKFVKTVPFRPSLCPLPCDKKELKYLENIRVKCRVSGLGHSESGEVQFRKDSLSGIVIFNFAARMARQKLDEAVLSLDLFPDIPQHDLAKFIAAHDGNLSGLCVNGIARNILERGGGIPLLLKNYKFTVRANRDFTEAQCATGGVDLSEIDNLTFESKKHKGLYIVGEALDIDGECGGFNLHFATVSGISAAKHIANR